MANTSWFLSRIGRKVTYYASLGLSVSGFTGYVLVHGLCLDKYKSIIQLYSEGEERPLPQKLKDLSKHVCEEFRLRPVEGDKIQFFSASGNDSFHAGSTNLRWGAIVGLPFYFNYNKRKDVQQSEIKVYDNMKVQWNSDAGEDLLNSFVLSDKAKKFAVARELYHCTSQYVYVNGFLTSTCIAMSYLLGNGMAVRYNFYRLRFLLRSSFYFTCASLGLCMYFMTKDAISQYYDRSADLYVAEKSHEYLEGGIEYYEKMLKRNIAMRKLLGDYGEKIFTWHGNEKTFIRIPHLQLTARLDNLKELKEKINSKLTQKN